MKVGDLVISAYGDVRIRRGLLIEQVRDRRAVYNKVFKVLWQDNTIQSNVWDYDLEVISESW